MAATSIRRYLPDLALALFALVVVGVGLNTSGADSTTASRCSLELVAPTPPSRGAEILTAWVPAPSGTCELAEMLVLAARKTHTPAVYVAPRIDEVLERFSAPAFAQAAAAGAAPDIGFVDTLGYTGLAEEGYIEPLDA